MAQAYGIGGIISVQVAPAVGNGAPPNTFIGQLGQQYFDRTTTPWSMYIWNGTTWETDETFQDIIAVNGTFTGNLTVDGDTNLNTLETSGLATLNSLTVTDQSTLADTNIVGATNINTSGAATTAIGTGGTGDVTIGNITGNTAVTGSLTTSTSLTATLGNITATNGNLASATAGKGLVLTAVTASGAASGTVTCNGRFGVCTFTSPSVAGGADLTLTMANNAIVGSTSVLMPVITGCTTGASLTIKSITNSAGQSVIVLTNATGATTSTANISIIFLVLN